MTIAQGIQNHSIHQTPIAVIDFETTGLTPGYDRVVEISVVKLEPNREPYLAFDTLVNPQRSMAASEIHGITDDDVAQAPLFSDIAGDFVAALSGCVVAAYNVYFDIRFLDYELQQVGVVHQPPHFCLMYMRPLLDLGKRCNLEQACKAHDVDYEASHIAAEDALASAKLLEYYLKVLTQRNISTYDQLSTLRKYKFFNSFSNPVLPEPAAFNLSCSKQILSRAAQEVAPSIDSERHATAEYWDALKTVVADLEITSHPLNSNRARLFLTSTSGKIQSTEAV